MEKRPGFDKRSKTAGLIIHEEIPLPPESIPVGSIFKDYQPFTVQGIKIKPAFHRLEACATNLCYYNFVFASAWPGEKCKQKYEGCLPFLKKSTPCMIISKGEVCL